MNTRYPIVLVHGLGMKDTFYMRSWGRIDRVLRARGCNAAPAASRSVFVRYA